MVNKVKFAKLAVVTTTVEYLNKIAELKGEEILTAEEISKVVSRADDKMPDSVVTTLDDEALTSKVMEVIQETAEELKEESMRPDTAVDPNKVDVKPIGAGSVLNELATNPHANVGGVDQAPAVNIIETNLLNNKEEVDKMANSNNVFETLKSERANGSVKMATIADAILKIAEAVIVSPKKLDSTENEATDEKVQNNKEVATQPSDVTAPVDANAEKFIQDPQKMKDKSAEEAANDSGANPKPNMAHKGASSRNLADLIAKHTK